MLQTLPSSFQFPIIIYLNKIYQLQSTSKSKKRLGKPLIKKLATTAEENTDHFGRHRSRKAGIVEAGSDNVHQSRVIKLSSQTSDIRLLSSQNHKFQKEAKT